MITVLFCCIIKCSKINPLALTIIDKVISIHLLSIETKLMMGLNINKIENRKRKKRILEYLKPKSKLEKKDTGI